MALVGGDRGGVCGGVDGVDGGGEAGEVARDPGYIFGGDAAHDKDAGVG